MENGIYIWFFAKKKYVKPAAEFVDVEAVNMLAVSGEHSIGITDKEADSNYDALCNERRGIWGNLWN